MTFVVKNSGAIAHEFVLGDQAAQQAHEDEMAHGGMTMDEPMAIGVDPGATKELTVTLGSPGYDPGRVPCRRPLEGGHAGNDHRPVGALGSPSRRAAPADFAWRGM